ncbi:phage tail protein [Spirosoma spitsbergense]|jgi:microcystin-dependent protein|uniref:phage tail protein n=1 Tax=Spirosoma spitsbergense TaxID=431554 RepID=UPI000363DE24|nr:tail fiber protein [Spirosoma spitsbergense]
MTGQDPYIGEIGIAGFNFAPRSWALCNGQLLSIAQNTALFSLLGTQYGGNGQTTFGLPNLQGCVAIHKGQGPGLSDYVMGQTGGSQTATLQVTNMPAHTHNGQSGQTPSLAQPATSQAGTSNSPDNTVPAATSASRMMYTPAGNASMAPYTPTLQPAGGGQPINIMQAGLVLTYCICTQGVFPSRN